jgi:hypothetical protein
MSDTAPYYSSGGITLVVINLSPVTKVQLTFVAETLTSDEENKDLLSQTRYEYIFSSNCGTIEDERAQLACKKVRLNGEVLDVDPSDGSIPPITPRRVHAGQPLVLEPLTLGYVALPRARASACM